MLGKSTDEKEMGKDDGHWSYSVWHSGRGEAMMAGGRQGLLGSGAPCLLCLVTTPALSSILTVLARDFPWTTAFSMLYIDNPVRTTGHQGASGLASRPLSFYNTVMTAWWHFGQQQATSTKMFL